MARAYKTPGASMHWYDKEGCQVKRKIGHVNITANGRPEACRRLDSVAPGARCRRACCAWPSFVLLVPGFLWQQIKSGAQATQADICDSQRVAPAPIALRVHDLRARICATCTQHKLYPSSPLVCLLLRCCAEIASVLSDSLWYLASAPSPATPLRCQPSQAAIHSCTDVCRRGREARARKCADSAGRGGDSDGLRLGSAAHGARGAGA